MVDQRRIGEWHEAAFNGCEPKRIGRKLLEECAELFCALSEHGYSDGADVRGEIADVLIVLSAIAHRCCVDMDDAVREKFPAVTERHRAA